MKHRESLSIWLVPLTGLGVALAILLTIAFTIGLILETHPVVPESFVSWQELGCSLPTKKEELQVDSKSSTPQFLGITECGRGYLTGTPRDSSAIRSSSTNTTIFDIRSNQEVCNIKGDARDSTDRDVLSRNRRYLLQSRDNQILLRDLAKKTEMVIPNKPGGFPQFSFNKPRDTALVRTENSAVLWDLAKGSQVSSIERPRRGKSFGFSDAEGQAKCLTESDCFEIWNEEKGFREFVLTKGSREADRYEGFLLAPDSRTIALAGNDGMTVWSLEDGSIVYDIRDIIFLFKSSGSAGSALLPCELNIALSNNSRWLLIYRHYQQDPLITWAEERNSSLGKLLGSFLRQGVVSELIDLNTGKIWSGMPRVQAGAFSDDDTRLVTFCDGGKYEWSVPPRRQLLTPFAWVTFGAWGSLIAILWGVRNLRRVAVVCLRMPK